MEELSHKGINLVLAILAVLFVLGVVFYHEDHRNDPHHMEVRKDYSGGINLKEGDMTFSGAECALYDADDKKVKAIWLKRDDGECYLDDAQVPKDQ